jgi:CheY-like chemotaxis protein
METAFQLRILIVEDTLPHVQMIKHMIDRLGYDYEVTHFISGHEAFKYLHELTQNNQSLPNLIILDLKLPGENGLEILKKIKANETFKHIPVILNSSYAEADDIREAYKEEGSFFVSKNYDLQALSDVITQLKTWGRLN